MLATTPPPAATPAERAEGLKERWRAGAAPDAAGALRADPELLAQRSVATDLMYEAFCLLEEAERAPTADEFCRTLPAYQTYMREVLRGHQLCAALPELFPVAPEWPADGDEFEGLVVVRELGRGAFARAYLARDPATGDRPVVLKLSPTPSAEARTLGPVDHPHVASVYSARAVRGLHAIVMPFVGATTLADVIEHFFPPAVNGVVPARPARPARSAAALLAAIDAEAPAAAPPLLAAPRAYPDAVAAVFARLAGALAHLHARKVCHGDLKPANVILAPGGHPYLIDFNLATTPDGDLLRLGGTLPYMPPERVRAVLGETKEPGPATAADVFGLGAVLFHALAGRAPVEPAPLVGTSALAHDLLRRWRATTPAAVVRDPAVPPPLARVIARCLDPDPTGRPTAAELELALDRYAQRHARHARWARRAAVAAGLALALLAAGFATRKPPPDEPPQPAPVVVAPTKPVTAADFFARGVASLRANDPPAAAADFGAANRARPHPDGRTTAFLAHCQSRMNEYPTAADYYQAAEQQGYAPAWARSNRAYCLIRCDTPDAIRRAVTEADEALKQEPGLRAARLNRAYARFLAGFDPRTCTLANPDACLADLDEVMKEGPYTADLYFKAAVMLTAANRPELHALAVKYVREAVRGGRNRNAVGGDPVLSRFLAGRDDFRLALATPAVPPVKSAEPTSNPHLVEPPAP